MDLNERFIKGLKQYNLSIDEINKSGWKYCGGDSDAGGPAVNYFRLIFGDHPDKVYEGGKEDYCVCGHPIVKNFNICDGNEEEILVLGSECITKFVDKKGRTCSLCGNSHKNRIVNRCNDCRKGLCDKCDKEIDEQYKVCYKCKFN